MLYKAAILYQIDKPLQIEELTIPELRTGQVLVKIAYSAVCHSQLNEIQGLKGEDKYLPHTLGHEGSGIVETIGPGVEKVKPGDHVVLSWIKASGIDAIAPIYYNGNCKINSGAISTFSQYSIISENRLTKISKKMPLDIAALLGCAFSTGGRIIFNTLKVKEGSSIAVFGVGGVGSSAVLASKIKNCSNIIAVDIFEEKLNYAKKLGATHLINSKQKDAFSILKNIVPCGLDYAVEASGKKEMMEMVLKVIKDSGIGVIAGNLKAGYKISIDPFELIKGKRIIGTWGGETVPQRDFPLYAKLYLSKQLPLDILITDLYRLESVNQAFDKLEQGSIKGRALIKML